MLTLPSIAAANLERQGKLCDAAMAQIVTYTRTDYVADLLKGRSDTQAIERIVKPRDRAVGSGPGLRAPLGRTTRDAGLPARGLSREGKLGSRYDSNVTSWDPFPFAPTQRTNDPMLDSIIAPTTTAMVDFITRTVGWKYSGRYNALSYEVNKLWERRLGRRQGYESDLARGSVRELRSPWPSIRSSTC